LWDLLHDSEYGSILWLWHGLHLARITSWQAMSDHCSIAVIPTEVLQSGCLASLLCCLQDTEQLIAACANQLEIAQRWEQQTQVRAAAVLRLRVLASCTSTSQLAKCRVAVLASPQTGRQNFEDVFRRSHIPARTHQMLILWHARSPSCAPRCRRRW
jgi:hypothetical protein